MEYLLIYPFLKYKGHSSWLEDQLLSSLVELQKSRWY